MSQITAIGVEIKEQCDYLQNIFESLSTGYYNIKVHGVDEIVIPVVFFAKVKKFAFFIITPVTHLVMNNHFNKPLEWKDLIDINYMLTVNNFESVDWMLSFIEKRTCDPTSEFYCPLEKSPNSAFMQVGNGALVAINLYDSSSSSSEDEDEFHDLNQEEDDDDEPPPPPAPPQPEEESEDFLFDMTHMVKGTYWKAANPKKHKATTLLPNMPNRKVLRSRKDDADMVDYLNQTDILIKIW